MAPVQSTYRDNIRPAIEGMQADMTPSSVISREVETVAGIKFGRAVYQGTASRQVLDGGAGGITAANYVGFALRDRSAIGTVENGYAVKETAAIMTKGTIWVKPAVDVLAGDPVFVRPSNGDLQKSNANSAIQVPNARWEDTVVAGAGVLAIIRLG